MRADGRLALFGIVCFALRPTGSDRPSIAPRCGRCSRSAAGFLLQNVALFARQNADYVAVGTAFGAAVVGFYSMAWRLADLTYRASRTRRARDLPRLRPGAQQGG